MRVLQFRSVGYVGVGLLFALVLDTTTFSSWHGTVGFGGTDTSTFGWPKPWLHMQSVVIEEEVAGTWIATGRKMQLGGVEYWPMSLAILAASMITAAIVAPFYLLAALIRRCGRDSAIKPAEPTGTGRLLFDPPPNHVILLLG